MTICPRCGSKSFWHLSTGQSRCTQCGLTRKFGQPIWDSARIPPYWKERLLEYFCLGLPAHRLRAQVPLNPKTVQRWFRLLREAIYHQQMRELSAFAGEIEMNGPAFGGRVPGEYGWVTADTHIVWGLFQEKGMILTFPIADRGNEGLFRSMSQQATAGELCHTDDGQAYIFLEIRGNHVVIAKEKGRPKGKANPDGIEGFWSYGRHSLYQYRSIPKRYFHLYLKEIEWRYNHRSENLVTLLRNLIHQRTIEGQTTSQVFDGAPRASARGVECL